MTENVKSSWLSRFSPRPFWDFLIHPSATLQTFGAELPRRWLAPMLLLSLSLVARLILTGRLQLRLAGMGAAPLPPDWQFWTPEMQANYTQAMQATQGPTFVYIIPIVLGLGSLWLGWLAFSGLLHLASTLLGGRGSMGSALNITAWTSLPFVLRDGLRIIFMLITRLPIAQAGLSGFSENLFLGQILALVDVFLLWNLILLWLGLRAADSLTAPKAFFGALGVTLLSLLTQAALAAAAASLSGMMITRPFF
ncbi:MAG: hypothetical protein OHK0031_05820 [Anaerolineales bacterium]